MIRFLSDEDFTAGIIDGVRSRLPDVDILRVQDAGLRSIRDQLILEFAAAEDRVVLSHDLKTMRSHATARLLANKPMPGLILIRQSVPVGRSIEEIVFVAECSHDGELNSQIQYLPLR